MIDTDASGLGALSGTFLFLTTTTIVLRFVARYQQHGRAGVDDYLAVASWLGFVALAALSFYGITHKFMGFSQPASKKKILADHPMVATVYLCIDAISGWTFGMAKLSALFFYRRIFCTGPISRQPFHYITAVCIAIVAIWTVIFFIMPFKLCGPHSVHWAVQPGNSAKCKLDYPYFKATTISDFILEILVLCLPIPMIWSLHTTTARKVAVSMVFAFAFVSLGASIARLVIFNRVVDHSRALHAKKDGYRLNTQNAYYTLFEAGFSLLAVNLPSMWYFLSGASPDRLVRSVRSLVSLASNRPSVSSNNAPKFSTEQPEDHEMDTYGNNERGSSV